ncbi:hypothetical protein ACFO5U_15725 [Planococcus dechangensis]|uniref:Uncharacterized protein n=1 Tax=Planococcus dechangensis TaxID=1176255 RepID=A0ABV9MGR2_9BACL
MEAGDSSGSSDAVTQRSEGATRAEDPAGAIATKRLRPCPRKASGWNET